MVRLYILWATLGISKIILINIFVFCRSVYSDSKVKILVARNKNSKLLNNSRIPVWGKPRVYLYIYIYIFLGYQSLLKVIRR